MSILQQIQTELKAPKGQYNSFGKYKYRSCEDILEAVKPLLAKHGAELMISDNIEFIGDRFYVRATAVMRKDGEVIGTATAFAREPAEKKGMDESQITGTASSYARKYALNGLLLIDDTKDDDTDEAKIEREARSKKTPNKDKNTAVPEGDVKPESELTQSTEKIDSNKVKAIRARLKAAAEKGKVMTEDAVCRTLKISSGKIEDMTEGEFRRFCELMEKYGL